MKKNMVIEDFQQLKALSDPLRANMMMHLVMKAYTGQQLSEIMGIPRGKLHYHLKDLEKNKLIEIVKTEEKNGIMQKFYQAVATDFQISGELLPHKKEVEDTTRQIMYSILERAKHKVKTAPNHAFESKEPNEGPLERGFISSTLQVAVSEEQFKQWKEKYYQLLEELQQMEEQTDGLKKNYYITTLGFQTDEMDGE